MPCGMFKPTHPFGWEVAGWLIQVDTAVNLPNLSCAGISS